MCRRFTLDPTTKFYERFKVTNRLDALTARYNIAPPQDVPVIIRNSPNRIMLMRWGLIPHWAKDENIGSRMINARAETLMPCLRYTEGCLENDQILLANLFPRDTAAIAALDSPD